MSDRKPLQVVIGLLLLMFAVPLAWLFLPTLKPKLALFLAVWATLILLWLALGGRALLFAIAQYRFETDTKKREEVALSEFGPSFFSHSPIQARVATKFRAYLEEHLRMNLSRLRPGDDVSALVRYGLGPAAGVDLEILLGSPASMSNIGRRASFAEVVEALSLPPARVEHGTRLT